MKFEDNKHAFFYLKKVVDNWENKGYDRCSAKIADIPFSIYIRIITKDLQVIQGLYTGFDNSVLSIKNTYLKEDYKVKQTDLVATAKSADDPLSFVGIYFSYDQVREKVKKMKSKLF